MNDLYSNIWKDRYPKKIKYFMWELSLGAMDTVDWLQRRMPYYVPFWCIMCQYHDESPAYLFMHCSFDSRF